jgi:hypothetical protein
MDKSPSCLARAARWSKSKREGSTYSAIASIWHMWHGMVIVSFAMSLVQVMGYELSLQGATKMRMYFPDRIQEQSTVLFTINIRDCNWLLRFVRDEGTNAANARDYEEVSFDGTNVYYVCNMTTKIERQRSIGDKLDAPNVALGRAYKGQLFHLRVADEVGPIWLAYASGCYLQSRTNQFIEPAMVFDGSGVTYGPPKHAELRAQWTLSDSSPRFPVWLAYFSDGYMELPSGRVRRPKPYDAGFTNAVYCVEAFTNANGLQIPLASSLKIFKMKPNATASTDLYLFAEYQMNVSNIAHSIDVVRFQPEIPGITVVHDERFGRQAYYATNKWPTVEELRTGPYFEAVRRINARHSATGNAAKWIRLLFILLILLPLTLTVAKLLLRKCQVSEKNFDRTPQP